MKTVVGNADVLTREGVIVTDLYAIAIYDYTGTLAETLYFTSFEAPIRWHGGTPAIDRFYGTDLLLNRTEIGWKTGVEVSSVQLDCGVDPDGTSMSDFLSDVLAGVYDNAIFYMFQLFLDGIVWARNPEITAGPYIDLPYESTDYAVVQLFSGRIGDVEGDALHLNITINSTLELLNVGMPKNLFSPSCGRTLYVNGCPVSKTDNTYIGTVGAGATVKSVPVVMTSPPADGYFAGGILAPLDGLPAYIKWWSANTIYLARPLRTIPAEGTEVTMWPGCDKTLTTCKAKFKNSSGVVTDFSEYFRGFPWIPDPETAY